MDYGRLPMWKFAQHTQAKMKALDDGNNELSKLLDKELDAEQAVEDAEAKLQVARQALSAVRDAMRDLQNNPE